MRLVESPTTPTAEDWDRWYTELHSYPPASEAEASLFLRRVRPRPGMTALDAGCGTGVFARQLARWGLTVTGVDFSAVAIAQARRAGHRSTRYERYEQFDVTADAIPPWLTPASFDIIVCRRSLAHVDRARFMTDARRWLRPDGAMYVLTARSSDGRPAGFRNCGLTEQQIDALGCGWADVEHRTVDRNFVLILRGPDGGTGTRCPASDGT
ncbi:class I SAM-dependent methyltransferase [Streptomyces sp. x-80]|uniref:class I SAM-dependent methyltransferase n=1 Tax=Streptomyces sp. x-80 TaxID=2789282 RepID=UPI00398068BB